MSGNILLSNRTVWSLGLLAFAVLCGVCVYWHAPQFAALDAEGALPVTTAPVSSNLEVRLFNGKVTLTGLLPDPAAKAQVIERAKGLYGANNLIDNLKVSHQTAFPKAGWFNAALSLLPFVQRMNNEGGFGLDGSAVTLRGLVESEDLKSKLVADAGKVVGNSLRVEDKVLVKGKVTTAQATDFQAKLNQMMAGKIVEFDTSSDVLTDKGRAVLNEMVKVLNEVPGLPVEIGGHTDARGEAALNENLSRQRARACLQYLVQKGVNARRLSSYGYGSSKPLADNNTAEGQQRNRRIEFTVLSEGK